MGEPLGSPRVTPPFWCAERKQDAGREIRSRSRGGEDGADVWGPSSFLRAGGPALGIGRAGALGAAEEG